MNTIFDTYKKSGQLHHAYCIECRTGERAVVAAELVCRIEKDLGVPASGNPDFWQGEFDSLGIEEGRMLKELQANRAFGGGKKVFVVSANTLTREAQNSLLKVFEEPTPGTHFFLMMSSAESLLPTLRSRLVIVRAHDDAAGIGAGTAGSKASAKESEPERLAHEFLAAKSGERMKMAKDIAERISDEELTRTDATAFVSVLEEKIRTSFFGKNGEKVPTRAEGDVLSGMLRVRDYLGDRSASVKMLLEHLALIIPGSNQK